MNTFTVDGLLSSDFGIVLEKATPFNAPARAYEAVQVPGRNGELHFDEGRYDNVIITYECGILETGLDLTNSKLDLFRQALMGITGYVKITDTYHPGEYRLGRPINAFEVTTYAGLRTGKFIVTFSCKPQRFLLTGDTTTTITSTATFSNPTLYAAKPLLKVYGYGQFRISSGSYYYNVTIASHSRSYLVIDSENQDCYYSSENMNEYVTVVTNDTDNTFPIFQPGTLNVDSVTHTPSITAQAARFTYLASTITQIDVTPRWCQL